MKPFFLLLFLNFCFFANAKNFYFSNSGNDSNNGTLQAPWKTLIKFNKEFSAASPGDNFLLKRGDTFYGSIMLTQSGTADLPITIGAYGTGNAPVITGFTAVKAWRNLGNNIWESITPVSSLPTCNMVVINGVNTAMGRTPNYPDYYTWDTHTKNSVATKLPATPDWSGAEIAIFTTTYRNARHTITSQTGGNIFFSSENDLWQNSPGYFFQQFHIQNDIRTLDIPNEWYYNPLTKKLDIYNTTAPTGVMAASVGDLVSTNNQSFIIIRDIALAWADGDGIAISASTGVKIINCNITYIGGTAIYGMTGGVKRPGLRIDSNKIYQANNSGIDLKYWYTGDTIRYNAIRDIDMLVGMQNHVHTIGGGPVGIGNESDNAVVSYNTIDSTGISGISYKGSNVSIDHNLVTNTCIGNGVRDLGAIYTWNGVNKPTSGTKVFNNIVINTGLFSEGIYFDNGSHGIEIYNNTCYHVLRGIYLDDCYDINIHDNTTFNTNTSGNGAGLFMNNNRDGHKLRNIIVKNNKFIAKDRDDRSLWVITSDSAAMPRPFISDSNYFAKPVGDNVRNIQTDMNGTPYVQRDLSGWQELNGQDAHSKQSPKAVKDTSDFNFQYNATNAPVTISLPFKYLDITGVIYNGSVTIPPYSSWVGIKASN